MKIAIIILFVVALLLTPVILSLQHQEKETAGGGGYNVVFRGQWTAKEKAIVMSAVEKVGKRLAELTGEAPQAAFNRAFVKKVIFRKGNLGGWYARVVDNTVTLSPQGFKQFIIIHELGHVYSFMRNRKPERALCNQGIYDANRRFLTGCKGGRYNRNAGRSAPKNGYYRDYFSKYTAHPRSIAYGNTACEDWADLFMNWVNKSFVDNRAGRALYAWVDSHMRNWLR
jgi:hypothetical protein